ILSAAPLQRNNGLNWNIMLNFTRNRSKVLELTDGLEIYSLTGRNGATIQARVGERMGNIYGAGFQRVEGESSPYYGQIIHNSTGYPLTGSELKLQGNYNPDWMVGVQNSFSYKNISLGFLFDGRYGGTIVSMTKTIGSTSGQIVTTLFGREIEYALSVEGDWIISPGVSCNADGSYTASTIKLSVRDCYNRYYERSKAEPAKYSASFSNWREMN